MAVTLFASTIEYSKSLSKLCERSTAGSDTAGFVTAGFVTAGFVTTGFVTAGFVATQVCARRFPQHYHSTFYSL